MQEIIPRFEFRAFAQNFGLVEDRLHHLGQFEGYRESSEVYVLSTANHRDNVKIRYDKLDIKTLLKEQDGLEQWTLRCKAEFPLSDRAVAEAFDILGVGVPELPAGGDWAVERLLEQLLRPHPELRVAQVFKRRYGYQIDGCSAEIADLLVNGAAIRTVAVESEDPQAARRVRARLGLGEYPNVNYPLALKRITGMEPPA